MWREPIAENEYYHIYNRGTDKRTIFLNESDYNRFTRLLYVCNGDSGIVMRELSNLNFSQLVSRFSPRKPLVSIGAYCLMPNHFHLLVREIRPNGTSQFMEKILTAYSMYFNKKNKRTGALFEGRFKSSRVETDNYLQYLFAYIHLNPVKLINSKWKEQGIKNMEKTRDFLKHYRYSSYLDFIGENRPEMAILEQSHEMFPEYFENFTEFDEFIDAWLKHKEDQ